MKINELIEGFEIFKTNEERTLLDKLKNMNLLSSFSEHDQFIIEGMVRKSLVIKIGTENPRVIANEF
jgi:hypothetical protein